MKTPVLGILILLVFNCLTIFAKDNLAVLPFSGGSGEDGETIAELFMFDPTINSTFAPIPRTSITRAMRGERSFQLSGGMTDPDSAVLLGRELGAKYVIAGNIARLGDRNLLVIGIINTETLEEIAGDIQTFANIEEMPKKLPAMAQSIVAATKRDSSKLPKLAATRVAISGNDESGDVLAQILAVNLVQNSRYAVYPRTKSLEQVQSEWGNQTSGDTADKNIVRIGAGTNPRYALSCVARRLGSQTMFNASIIDLESGVQAAGASVNYTSLNEGIEAMKTLARDLSFADVTEWRVDTEDKLREIVGIINSKGEGNYSIILNGSFSISNSRTANSIRFQSDIAKTINIKGDSQRRTITNNSTTNRDMFSITGRINLVLGEQLTLDGNRKNGRILGVFGGSSVTLLDGVILQNANATGILINDGTLIMNGGTITGCNGNNSDSVGGVSISHTSSFTMNGGIISNNISRFEGGGVNSSGTFTMNGGTITGNSCSSQGGGVRASKFTMNGGTISNNTAGLDGGGVNVSGTKDRGPLFTMTGGTISGNKTQRWGGGVYIDTNVNFTKTGGTIDATNLATDKEGRGNVVYFFATDKFNPKEHRIRNRAAGPNDNMSSNTSGKSGGWD